MPSPENSKSDSAWQPRGIKGGRNDLEQTSQDLLDDDLPSHTGLLREKVLVLRDILGYVEFIGKTTTLKPPQIGVPLPNSRTKDLLLVGLDIDTFQGYEQLTPDQQLHIGISLLDTRKLQALLANSTQDPNSSVDVIDSYQFTVGSSKYCRKASNKFMFGRSEAIEASQFPPRLQELIEGRNFTFVCHGSHEDMKMLRNLDIDLASFGCLYVFDTNKVAQWILQLHYRLGLERLLERLEIPFDDLHAAGNDAHFSLRALLMLAVKDADRLQQLHPGCATVDSILQIIRQIAQAPRPTSRSEAMRQQKQVLAERKIERKFNRKQARLARKERRRETLEARAKAKASEKAEGLEERDSDDSIEEKTDE